MPSYTCMHVLQSDLVWTNFNGLNKLVCLIGTGRNCAARHPRRNQYQQLLHLADDAHKTEAETNTEFLYLVLYYAKCAIIIIIIFFLKRSEADNTLKRR